MQKSRVILDNIYRDKFVLVTGGTGFLGKHITARLEEAGAIVFAIGTAQQDLRQPFFIEDLMPHHRPDLIIHLAAKIAGITENSKTPYAFLYDNSLINLHMVDYTLKMGVPLVAAGSVCVYSDDARLPFLPEDMFKGEPEKTNYGYGLSKRYLAHLLQTATMQFPEFRYVFINAANLYGPGDHFGPGSHVIPALIRKVAESPNNDNRVILLGSGEPTRDFLYVEDAADAYLLAGSHLLKGGVSFVCNIGSGQETFISQVLQIICEEFGYTPDVIFDMNSPRGQLRRLVDSSMANVALSWRARTALRDGIRQTIEWYQSNYIASASNSITAA